MIGRGSTTCCVFSLALAFTGKCRFHCFRMFAVYNFDFLTYFPFLLLNNSQVTDHFSYLMI